MIILILQTVHRVKIRNIIISIFGRKLQRKCCEECYICFLLNTHRGCNNITWLEVLMVDALYVMYVFIVLTLVSSPGPLRLQLRWRDCDI